MWIEIDLDFKGDSNTSATREICVYNFKQIEGIDISSGILSIMFRNNCHHIDLPPKETAAVYQALKLALQGQVVKLEGLGTIKPLLNEQQEALHKHLLYTQTLNSLQEVD